MKKKLYRYMAVFICALLAVQTVPAGITEIKTFAASDDPVDYRIDSASWRDEYGAAIAEWEKPDSATRYKLQLYRGTTKVGNLVSCGNPNYDFTQAISKKGTGNYHYEVMPVKGGESYKVVSDILEVDSDMLSAIRTYLKERKAEAQAAAVSGEARWVMNPNNTWQYVNGQGGYAKNEWMDIDGKRYYFGSDSLMKTGWQKIGSVWYYLGTDGAMWYNATTPDGYYVDENGVWIDLETGKAGVSAKSNNAKAGDPSVIYTVRMSLKELSADPGQFRKVEVRAPSNVTITNTSFDTPYENWGIGSSIVITVEISANKELRFSDSAQYSMGSLKLISSTGDDRNRRLSFRYFPRMTLKTPDGLYINSDGTLRWEKVPHAIQYRVVVSYSSEESDSTSSKTVTVTKPEIDLSEYTDAYWNVTVKITAQAGKNNRTYAADSKAAEIPDLESFKETNTLDGTFKTTISSLTFRDDSGEKLTGWQELAGSWYYFKPNGNAVEPGWFHDKEGGGYWYWFDEDHRMVTGTITVDGVDYFLNDGVYDHVPYGAWVEGEYE